MASKLFISAKEVAKELEVSDSYAYRLIRQLNAENWSKKVSLLSKEKSAVNILKNEFTV